MNVPFFALRLRQGIIAIHCIVIKSKNTKFWKNKIDHWIVFGRFFKKNEISKLFSKYLEKKRFAVHYEILKKTHLWARPLWFTMILLFCSYVYSFTKQMIKKLVPTRNTSNPELQMLCSQRDWTNFRKTQTLPTLKFFEEKKKICWNWKKKLSQIKILFIFLCQTKRKSMTSVTFSTQNTKLSKKYTQTTRTTSD